MCGISAIIINENCNLNFKGEIKKMNDSILHRGPDDEGYLQYFTDNIKKYYFGESTPKKIIENESKDKIFNHINDKENDGINKLSKILLGHRRLSILDLSKYAHQPMSDDTNKYTIIYNGEIYNFRKLKSELQNCGMKFKSDSDTEVILNMYIKYGVESFKRLKGMWAFIILDLKLNKVVGSRDRFGIKPLYYFIDKYNNIYFASEIKQFSYLSEWKPILNKDRAYDYIVYAQTDHTNETLFKGVQQCPAGHYFEYSLNAANIIKPNKINFIKWYDLEKKIKKTDINNLEIYKKNLRELIIKSNIDHNIADVPVSYCLSGGIDSSILVMDRSTNNTNENIHTFSIFSEDNTIDEKNWVKEILINSKNIINQSEIPKLEKFLDQLDLIIWSLDEPPCDSTIYSEWSVYNMISNNKFKVTISGQGADEIFGGYHNYFSSYLSYLFLRLRFYKFFNECSKIKKIYNYDNIFLIKELLIKLIPNFFFKIKNFFNKKLNTLFNLKKSNAYRINKNIEREKIIGIKNLSIHQIKYSMLPKLLRYADRTSMYHSLEVRVPYLDNEIIEYSLSIPDDLKIKNGKTKYILRESFEKILPPKIFNRTDKIGFEVASKKWLTNKAQNIKINKYLISLIDNTEGIFNKNTVKYIKGIMKNNNIFDDMAFRLIFFSIWMKVFKVKMD